MMRRLLAVLLAVVLALVVAASPAEARGRETVETSCSAMVTGWDADTLYADFVYLGDRLQAFYVTTQQTGAPVPMVASGFRRTADGRAKMAFTFTFTARADSSTSPVDYFHPLTRAQRDALGTRAQSWLVITSGDERADSSVAGDRDPGALYADCESLDPTGA